VEQKSPVGTAHNSPEIHFRESVEQIARMKTDTLFYELFRLRPESLFELTGLKAEGEYVFESITVKSSEKRFDGFFKCRNKEKPDVFLEVQGYYERVFYWRQIREISTRYEQTGSEKPFIAVVLFLDKKYDPDNCPISDFKPPNRLIRCYLSDCLKTLGDKASPLTVLKPLILRDKEELSQAVPKWKNEIDSLKLSAGTAKLLTELLEHAIVSRFPKMTRKEIEKMIHFTPLEKTVVGQELIQMGMEKGLIEGIEKGLIEGIEKGLEKGLKKGRIEGVEKGVEKGELIGKIHLAQRLLKHPVTPKKKLIPQSIRELRAIMKQLEKELKLF
jgi:predicted transposase YdaD